MSSAPRSTTMIIATFNPEDRLKPNNLTEVAESWDEVMRMEHGASGSFIGRGSYYTEPDPEMPEVLLSTDAGVRASLPYRLAESALQEAVKEQQKAKAKLRHDRPKQFAQMLAHTSTSARDHLMRDPKAASILEAGDDPLALWKLMGRALVSTKIGSDIAQQEAAMDAYNGLKQGREMSTPDYYKAYKGCLRTMKTLEIDLPSDARQSYHFARGLDLNRYAAMLNNIENGLVTRPTSAQGMYEMCVTFKTTAPAKSNNQAAFSAQQGKKGKKKPAQQSGEKKDPDTYYKNEKGYHHIPKSEMTRLRARAVERGYKFGSCAVCGKNHGAHACPNYPEKGPPMIEDAHVAADTKAVEQLEESDDESHTVFAAMRRIVKKSNKGAFKDGQCNHLHSGKVGLDTMASTHLFSNLRNIPKDKVKACAPTTFTGIGGTETITQTGEHSEWKGVYIRPGEDRSINLLSLSQLEDTPGVKVKYSQDERTFWVTSPTGRVHVFNRQGGKLYLSDEVYDEEEEQCYYTATGTPSVETVERNKELFSVKEIEGAERARALSAAMGFASQGTLKELIRAGRADGLDISQQDVDRAERVFGPAVEAIRGKTMRRKTKFAEPIVGKIVNPNCTVEADLAFFEKEAFVASVTHPMNLLQCTHVKSKSTADVKKALDGHIGTLEREGFKVTDVTADGEGAIGAMKADLDKAGCRLNIHSKSTDSYNIDNKLRQMKNCLRSVLTLPYRFPAFLLAAAVAFCVSKINMTPSRANYHNYSAHEILLGRPISVDRDLGGKGGNGPLAFGSRVEIFDKTTNTVADRTTPALFLGSKGNGYGSALFFKLTTKTIVSSDQWKALPMDVGTIARVNEIAQAGHILPGKLPIYFKGKEVTGEPYYELDSAPENRSDYVGRVVVDSGNEVPTGLPQDEHRPYEEDIEIVHADSIRPRDESNEQLIETSEVEALDDGGNATSVRSVRFAEGVGGDTGPVEPDVPVTRSEQLENRGAREAYNYPYLEASKSTVVEPPWFLAGEALAPSEGRPQRVRKAPDRLTYDAMIAADCSLDEIALLTQLKPLQTKTKHLPYRPTSGRTRIQAARLETRRARHHSAFIVAIDRAILQFGSKAVDSINKELTSVHKKRVFRQIMLHHLTDAQRRGVIRSKMFLKEKFFPDGTFDKLKCRIVAGGDMQDRSEYGEDETSSPTVSLSSVYLVVSVASREGRKVGTADVGTAYLNAAIKKAVHMRLDKRLAKMMAELFPDEYKLDKDGCIYVKLEKALYGCVESAKLWYDEVCATLLGLGFERNPHDICVFNIDRNGHQMTVCLYVDDLLMTSVDGDDIEWLADELRKKYETVTLNTGDLHSYLGQTFDFSVAGEVSVSMDGYIRDVLDTSDVKGFKSTPAATDLYDIDDSADLLSSDGQDDFRSMVMRLMFLAQRARPDILTAVGFLSRRCGKATSQDQKKLDRILMYLHSWPDLKMTLACEDELRVYGYVDASFAVHGDMKSHTGGIISLGKGAVNVSSKKQHLMTKSSTESELVGLSDQLPQIIWTRNFLLAQGYTMGPAVIYQDNQSTIALVAKGRSTSARTRHIAIRYFFIKDRVASGEVKIEYKATGDMRADIMTKPLQGDLFRRMRSELMGIDYIDESVVEQATVRRRGA